MSQTSATPGREAQSQSSNSGFDRAMGEEIDRLTSELERAHAQEARSRLSAQEWQTRAEDAEQRAEEAERELSRMQVASQSSITHGVTWAKPSPTSPARIKTSIRPGKVSIRHILEGLAPIRISSWQAMELHLYLINPQCEEPADLARTVETRSPMTLTPLHALGTICIMSLHREALFPASRPA